MTTQHNPDECARLIAEARNYAERKVEFDTSANALMWCRNQLRAMADQLEAQQAEIARLRESDRPNHYKLLKAERDTAREQRDRLQAELEAATARIARLESEHDTLCLVVERTTGTIDKLNATRVELEAARREVERLAACESEYRNAVLYLNAMRVPLQVDGMHLTMLQRIELLRAARDKAGGATVLSVTWRRGEADGRNGHPPAEITAEYLKGYAQGLESRP